VVPFAHEATAVAVGDETPACELPQAVITEPQSRATKAATGIAQVTDSLLRPAPCLVGPAPMRFLTFASPWSQLTTVCFSVGPMDDVSVGDPLPAVRGTPGRSRAELRDATMLLVSGLLACQIGRGKWVVRQ
jgi:hypothetical protein